jgi:hypothetical protein
MNDATGPFIRGRQRWGGEHVSRINLSNRRFPILIRRPMR